MVSKEEVKPEEYYDSPEKYIEKADRKNNQDLFSEFLMIRKNFLEYLNKDDKLLDAGCGPGVDADFFQPKVEEYIGIDISEKNIRFARKNKAGKFEVMDLRDLKFENSYFEAIWNSASLFFMPVEDMEKAIEEFSRVLAKDGVAFLSWKEGEGSSLKGEENKLREYYISQEKAEKMAKEHFEIVEKFRNKGRNQDFISFIVRQS